MNKIKLKKLIKETVRELIDKKSIKEQNINTQQFLSQFSCPAWSGFSNWVNNFTSLPNFTSTNPNQPCQFLCQRFTQWNNQVHTAGPVWAQQLKCKLRVTAQLKSIYNCGNSQAPAC